MHVHYAIPHAATAWLAKQMLEDEGLSLKIVTTLHGTDITLVGQDPSYYTLTKFSIEQSDAVTAVSAYLREETYRAFGCGQCEVRVIPNFIATADYHPPTDDAFRRRLAPQGHRVVVHVSNFRPVKRVGDVVKIFAAVRQRIPATLVLVGDGPDRDAAEHEVDSIGLRKDVRFLGKVESVGDVLRGADLFLLPSATESFGLAALEAMACAVPVIASVAGGWIDVRRIALPKALAFAALSGIALGAVGNTWNAIRDVAADRINRPQTRPLAAGQVSRGVADLIVFDGALLGLAFAGLVSGWLFLAAVAALAVMFVYSPLLKPRPLLGNVAVAVVAGPPPPLRAPPQGPPPRAGRPCGLGP